MRLSTLFQSLLAAVFLAISFPATAVSVDWGAFATSSITECADILCNTILTESQESVGENMDADAMTELNVGGNSSFAQATLSGTSFTPTLSVFAGATPGLNLVFASASGVQGYFNNGSDTTITVDLSLTADEVSGFGFVNAFAIVFLDTAVLEITEDSLDNAILGTGFENSAGSALLAAPAGTPPAPQMTSFSFEVLNNQNFLIWAGLQALSLSGGIADARNTLTMQLLDDNSPIDIGQFDVASNISSIPLPAGVWFFVTGIGVVAGLSRRRKVSTTS